MQPAELQERGPPSPLSPFLTPQEKLFIFPWQPPATDTSVQQLNWSSSPDRGEEKRGGEERRGEERRGEERRGEENFFSPIHRMGRVHKEIKTTKCHISSCFSLISLGRNQLPRRTSCCTERMHLPPLAWQQPVCVSLAGLAVQMFEMAWVMNYGTELPAASTSLATVFFSHSHQCLPQPDQRPSSPGLKGKHLQSCWTVLSCSINVTLSALVVGYFWARGGRTQTIKVRRKIPWVF